MTQNRLADTIGSTPERLSRLFPLASKTHIKQASINFRVFATLTSLESHIHLS
jgi:hypothetical protein